MTGILVMIRVWTSTQLSTREFLLERYVLPVLEYEVNGQTDDLTPNRSQRREQRGNIRKTYW
jgi:hypothetical protein